MFKNLCSFVRAVELFFKILKFVSEAEKKAFETYVAFERTCEGMEFCNKENDMNCRFILDVIIMPAL